MKKLTKYKLEEGMKVKDSFGDIGIIEDCSDLHDVTVKGDTWYASFCFVKDCPSNTQNINSLYLMEEENGNNT